MIQSSTRKQLKRRVFFTIGALLTPSLGARALAQATPDASAGPVADAAITQAVLPRGGAVTAGSAAITVDANSLTVTQASNKAIVSWDSFSIGKGGAVHFNNGTGATLNRVTGASLSSIDGLLSATGSVLLINPTGVVIGKDGVVETGGTFVASTLDISNENFLSNDAKQFEGLSTASVINLGRVGSLGGDVVMIAAHVDNKGQLTANNGTAGLLAGSSVILRDASLDNGQFYVQTGGANTSVTHTGAIEAAAAELKAHNGSIYAVAGNTQSYIKATGTGMRGGKIWLLAGSEGTTELSGVSLTATQGDLGGFIETSGGVVRVADDVRISTKSDSGKLGTWLIDPNDYTIAAAGGDITGAALATQLQTNHVTIQSVQGATAGNGDIFVRDAVSWSSGATLTLQAYRDINISAPITVGADGTVNLITGDQDMDGVGDGSLGDYRFGLGSAGFAGSITFTDGDPLAALNINGDAYTLLYSFADLEGISGDNGKYALARNLTASGPARTEAVIDLFDGTLTGLGHKITGLNIDGVGAGGPVGLIGELQSFGTVRDIGMDGGSAIGEAFVGGLVGSNVGTIHQSYATNTVSGSVPDPITGVPGRTGSFFVGGLAGYSEGKITRSYATGDVTGGFSVGGLVGSGFALQVSESYAIGDVLADRDAGGLVGTAAGSAGLIRQTYAHGAVTGGTDAIGGLVGRLVDGTVDQSYSIGRVTADTGATHVGGLVGIDDGGAATVSNSYWDTQTSGQTASAGGTGRTTAQLQGTLPSGFDAAAWGTGPSFYPYLRAYGEIDFGQRISGFAFNADGTAANTARVGLYSGGNALASVSTGADGSYYYLNQGADITATTQLGGILQLAGSTGIDGATFTDRPTLNNLSDVTGFNLRAGAFQIHTSASTLSAMNTSLSETFGSGGFLYAFIRDSAAINRTNIFASGAFEIDQGFTTADTVLVEARGGTLSIGTGGSISSTATGDAVTLAANGAFINNGGASAVSAANGRWLISSTTPANSTADVRGGLAGKSYYGSAYTFNGGGFSAPVGAGNRFVFGYRPTITVGANTRTVTYNGAVQSAVQLSGNRAVDASADVLAGLTGLTGVSSSSKNVGTYTLAAGGSVVSDMNYNVVVDSTPGALTINRAQLNLFARPDIKIYDGTTASTVQVIVGGLQAGDTVTGLSQSFDSRNAGQRRTVVTPGYSVNDGNGGANYNIATFVSNLSEIRQAPLTFTTTSATKTYDGTTASTGVVSVTGLAVGDTITGLAQSFDSRNAGARTLVVNPGFTINDGRGGTNYLTPTINAATGAINRAPLNFVLSSDTKTYDATTASTGLVTILGLQGTDTATATQAFTDRNARGTNGSTLTIGAAAIDDGNGGNNYAATVTSATGTINRAPLTISVGTETKVYDGTATSNGASIVGLKGTDTVSGAQIFDSRNAGARTISVNPNLTINDGNGGNNYALNFGARTASGTITKAPLTISAVSDTKVYDGTTASSKSPITGLMPGDTAVLRQVFDSKNAGTRTLSLDLANSTFNDGNGGNNYELRLGSLFATGTITRAPLTVTTVTDTKTYDGTTSSRAQAVINGLMPGDTANANQAFTDPNVRGANRSTLTWDPSNINDGNGGQNYSVNVTTSSGTINPARIFIQPDGRALVLTDAEFQAFLGSTLKFGFRGYVESPSGNGERLFFEFNPALGGLDQVRLMNPATDRFQGQMLATGQSAIVGKTLTLSIGTLSAGGNYEINFQDEPKSILSPEIVNAFSGSTEAAAKRRMDQNITPGFSTGWRRSLGGETTTVTQVNEYKIERKFRHFQYLSLWPGISYSTRPPSDRDWRSR